MFVRKILPITLVFDVCQKIEVEYIRVRVTGVGLHSVPEGSLPTHRLCTNRRRTGTKYYFEISCFITTVFRVNNVQTYRYYSH